MFRNSQQYTQRLSKNSGHPIHYIVALHMVFAVKQLCFCTKQSNGQYEYTMIHFQKQTFSSGFLFSRVQKNALVNVYTKKFIQQDSNLAIIVVENEWSNRNIHPTIKTINERIQHLKSSYTSKCCQVVPLPQDIIEHCIVPYIESFESFARVI